MSASETASSPYFGVLRVHLWKESRENRTAFLLILGVVLLACPAMVLTYRHFDWASGSAPGIAAGLTLVLAMVGLGDSVLSRELASSRRPALSRLPGAIRAAYLVRVPLYLGALSALVVIAYGWTLVFASACSFPMEARPIADYAPLLVIAAIFIAWSLTASCWIRQGVLAVPMALALLGFQVHELP